MQQLMFIEPGKLEWRDIADPKMQEPDDALVRPIVLARCDLDLAVLQGLAPFRGALLHFLRNHLPESLGQNGIFRKAPLKGPRHRFSAAQSRHNTRSACNRRCSS